MTDDVKDIPVYFEESVTLEEFVTAVLNGVTIVDLIWLCGFVESRSEAKRLVKQGAVSIANTKITDPRTIMVNGPSESYILWPRGKNVMNWAQGKYCVLYKGTLPLRSVWDGQEYRWQVAWNQERVDLWREEVEKKLCKVNGNE